jgi:hypothetical protein
VRFQQLALANRHVFRPFSPVGLVTALLLFIVARGLSRGTQPSEDIEGTV